MRALVYLGYQVQVSLFLNPSPLTVEVELYELVRLLHAPDDGDHRFWKQLPSVEFQSQLWRGYRRQQLAQLPHLYSSDVAIVFPVCLFIVVVVVSIDNEID